MWVWVRGVGGGGVGGVGVEGADNPALIRMTLRAYFGRRLELRLPLASASAQLHASAVWATSPIRAQLQLTGTLLLLLLRLLCWWGVRALTCTCAPCRGLTIRRVRRLHCCSGSSRPGATVRALPAV